MNEFDQAVIDAALAALRTLVWGGCWFVFVVWVLVPLSQAVVRRLEGPQPQPPPPRGGWEPER